MRICLSSRQSPEYLKKADEIKVQFRDKNSIADLIFEYPEATIILENIENKDLDWEEISKLNLLAQGKFVLCLASPKQLIEAKARNIKAYLGWLISDFETLNTVLSMGADYVRVSGPLFFNLEQVVKAGAKVRATPNIAFEDGLSRPDGVVGCWIRPEDLKKYESLIETIEFSSENIQHEQTLYKIYMVNEEWPGDLGLLIKDLNHTGVNRLIHPSLIEKRLKCKQKCQSEKTCQYCYRALNLANPDLLKKAKEK